MSEFPLDWKVLPLSEIAERVRRTSDDQHLDVLTISSTEGWVDQKKKWARDMAGKSIEKYMLLQQGEFSYNKGNSKTYPQGCIFRLENWRRALVPNVYHSFSVTNPEADGTFLQHLFASGGLNDQLRSVITSSVRDNGLLNITADTFFSTEILIPPLPEQKKIAEILSGIDNTTKAIFKKKKKNDLILRQTIIDATTPHHGSSWHESTIGDVVEFQGGAQPPRSTFKFAPEAGYIRMLQIRDYKSDARATYIPLDLCKRFCDREDVMIGRYGPPNFQILRGKEGSYNVALIKTMPKDSGILSKDYLYRFLQRGDLFVLMDTLSQRTSGQQGLDMDALKGFPMFIPDLATQDHICRSISAIESISLDLNARVQSLNHLKSGISGQLLSGRKRVSI